MPRIPLFAAATVALASTLAACGGGGDGDGVAVDPQAAFTLALIGDAPYGVSNADTAEFDKNPAFIAAINKDKDVAMVLHTGDIHSGKQYCTQSYDLSVFQQWSAFTMPMVYTPGDNEWIDCQKAKEGGGVKDGSGNFVTYAGGDPMANLSLVRSIFFSQPGQTLGKALTVHSQAIEYDKAFPSDQSFVENIWYEKSGVLLATVNLPGGSNNGAAYFATPGDSTTATAVQLQEVTNRTGAAFRWIDKAFAKAKANGDTAIVLMVQGDMWDLDGNTMAGKTLTEWKQYIDKLATLSKDFGKPVLLVNGDSHFYRSDNPMSKGAACKVEAPSTPIGTRSTGSVTCLDSINAGALTPIVPDGAAFADPYVVVQDKTNAAYVPTYDVPNFHRLVVHGNATAANTDMEYLKLTIDPKKTGTTATESNGTGSFGPFSWTRVQPTL